METRGLSREFSTIIRPPPPKLRHCFQHATDKPVWFFLRRSQGDQMDLAKKRTFYKTNIRALREKFPCFVRIGYLWNSIILGVKTHWTDPHPSSSYDFESVCSAAIFLIFPSICAKFSPKPSVGLVTKSNIARKRFTFPQKCCKSYQFAFKYPWHVLELLSIAWKSFIMHKNFKFHILCQNVMVILN